MRFQKNSVGSIDNLQLHKVADAAELGATALEAKDLFSDSLFIGITPL